MVDGAELWWPGWPGSCLVSLARGRVGLARSVKLMFSYGGCGDMSYGGRVGLAHVLVSLDGVTKALVA